MTRLEQQLQASVDLNERRARAADSNGSARGQGSGEP
jgi:hypothetical protein